MASRAAEGPCRLTLHNLLDTLFLPRILTSGQGKRLIGARILASRFGFEPDLKQRTRAPRDDPIPRLENFLTAQIVIVIPACRLVVPFHTALPQPNPVPLYQFLLQSLAFAHRQVQCDQ
jgi:hypothetical protein